MESGITTEYLPLMQNQKRLWILFKSDKTNPGYNLTLTYHLKGNIDISLLKRSITLLFNQQHTIFSVFVKEDGIPYIKIVPREISINLVDFTACSASLRREEILSYAGEESRKSFDIENGPLYRLSLLKENDESHYLHFVVHHIIFDGYSQKLFVQELSKIYRSLKADNSVNLPPLSFHSHDFAKAERTTIKDNTGLIEFWRKNLTGCPNELRFPYDYPRKVHSSGLGRREPFIISSENTSKLKEISIKENTSLFTTMVSFLGVFLEKYTGEKDICLGISISNRKNNPALEHIFGMFVNTSVVRLNVIDTRRFNEHLKYTKSIVKDAIVHSTLPFEQIVEAVKPERSSGLNPLFQASLSWLNDFTIPMDLGEVKGERITLPEGGAHFDLSFFMWEEGEIIKGEIGYSTDLLSRESVIRIKNNMLNLINNILNTPLAPIGTIPMITSEEKNTFDLINKTQTDYPKNKTVVQLFEEEAVLFPDKKAIVFNDMFLTYSELNQKANQLARTLRQKGVRKDIPVGIYTEKCLEMIIGMLGILKAGGAYLPLDPDYPVKRTASILREAECWLVLTQNQFMNIDLPGVNKIDLLSDQAYNNDKTNVDGINVSTDLAYIIYTSGTTGTPKGSMIQHNSVVRLVRNINYMEMSSDDRLLYTSAIVFDVTTYEIWGALLNGMTLYIADKVTILDSKALGRVLADNKITILHLTSALFTQLSEISTEIFSGLRYLLVGGDVLSPNHVNKVRRDNPHLKVINCYGPSENTTYSTTYQIDKTHESNIPIGKPVSNSTVYIFDRYLNYQPIGVVGELYVGGDGLSRGYLKRDDLNSTKFISHPDHPGDRLYKSGDYGKWLADGNIEFHGRIDNQIKIRGFRVELEGIEAVLSGIKDVVESVVKPVKLKDGDYKLVAFLNISTSSNLQEDDIIKVLKEKLPSYMIPVAYVFMHGFPKTINGKTDKNALRFEKSGFESKQLAQSDNLNKTEEPIYNIWSEALKKKEILKTDNFFSIGGTSLLAISVFSKINAYFRIDMPLKIFFNSPTIADLASSIELEKAMNKISGINTINKSTNIEGEL